MSYFLWAIHGDPLCWCMVSVLVCLVYLLLIGLSEYLEYVAWETRREMEFTNIKFLAGKFCLTV